MSPAPTMIVRRTVPYDVPGQPSRTRLTINAMRQDPDRVALVVNTPDGATRQWLEVGDSLELGEQRWRVDELVVGDRGSVVLKPASEPAG